MTVLHKKYVKCALILLFFLSITSAWAADKANRIAHSPLSQTYPLLYARSVVSIESLREVKPKKKEPIKPVATEEGGEVQKAEVEPKEKTKVEKEESDEEPKVAIAKRVHKFQTEIRPMTNFNLEWFQSFKSLKSNEAMLLVLDPGKEIMVDWSHLLVSIDLLYIQPNGVIRAIVSNVVPAENADELPDSDAARAFLLLAPGAAEQMDILPRDRVRHELFAPSPKVME